MNMYNLIEYSDNYADSTASLYQFKRQEQNLGNGVNIVNLDTDLPSFKYKSSAQIFVPLKYINNFFKSLELPLINTKLYIELNWIINSITSDNVGNARYQITKTNLYVLDVTLETENNNKLNELLETTFKRSIFWNEYKSKIETITIN